MNDQTTTAPPGCAPTIGSGTAQCHECGGCHEPSGARSDCIRHWKWRAVLAENTVSVEKHYGGILGAELRQWLNAQDITSENIGEIRRSLMVPWDSGWNALVRDETAERENSWRREAVELRREVAETTLRYNELIMAVAAKHEGESRHATALRYIVERENAASGAACESPNISSKP